MNASGFFGIGEHLKRLSETGDSLEMLAKIIDLEAFRPVLDAGLGYSDGSKGARPPYDPVVMFKVLILAAQNNVGDERMEFLIRDRPSWLRVLGFGLGDRTPDETRSGCFGKGSPGPVRSKYCLKNSTRNSRRVASWLCVARLSMPA